MNRGQHLYSPILGRRCFCGSIAGLAAGILVAKLPFWARRSSKIASTDQEFLIVNGWVLTRDDFAAAEMKSDVV